MKSTMSLWVSAHMAQAMDQRFISIRGLSRE